MFKHECPKGNLTRNRNHPTGVPSTLSSSAVFLSRTGHELQLKSHFLSVSPPGCTQHSL